MCRELRADSSEIRGDQFLASKFGVDPWSSEFFQIVFTISSRIDQLIAQLQELAIADDLKTTLNNNLLQIRAAFTPNGLQNVWRHASTNYLTPANLDPVIMLSCLFQQDKQFYPKLEAGEIAEICEQVDTLYAWLSEHQLVEQDFIRQAIMDGLLHFRFRLERVGWLGWGYTLQSLREVISAYIALEANIKDPNAAPVADAILRKTRDVVTMVFEKAHWAKEAVDTTNFMLKAYGAATLALQGGQKLAGLLAFVGS
jgi:hypothetical protein